MHDQRIGPLVLPVGQAPRSGEQRDRAISAVRLAGECLEIEVVRISTKSAIFVQSVNRSHILAA